MKVEVVDPYKDLSGELLAIAHIDVHEGATRLNLDAAKRVVFFASENGVSTVVLPYMQPYGPVLETSREIDRQHLRRSYGLTRESQYMSSLIQMADGYGIRILVSALIERASSKLYISSAFVSGYGEEGLSTRRKVVLGEGERRLGIYPGKEPSVFSDSPLLLGVLIGDELLYPEIARYAVESGATALLVALSQVGPPRGYVDLARSLASMLGVWVIVPGARLVSKNQTSFVLPTIVVNPQGDIVFRHYGAGESLVIVPKSALARASPRRCPNPELFYRLYRALYMRGRNGRAAGKSSGREAGQPGRPS